MTRRETSLSRKLACVVGMRHTLMLPGIDAEMREFGQDGIKRGDRELLASNADEVETLLVESECGAGGVRPNISVAAPFVWRCLPSSPVAPVSTPRSSNRTCRSPASGSRTRSHAFTHDGPRPSWVRRTSRKCPYRCESG